MLEDVVKYGVQKVQKPYHVWVFVLNVLLAGSGTLISAFYNVHLEPSMADPSVMVRRSKASRTTFYVAVFQILLSWIIIGWVWSIYWGFLIY